MAFPPKMVNNQQQRSQASQSTAEIHIKLTRLVSRHEQMKITYHQLKSQTKIGWLQAEEMFVSLAIPLMKLVGLKTVEMANEGRFTTIIHDHGFPHGHKRNGAVSKSPVMSPTGGGDHNNQIRSFEEESYANKATMAGKELIKNQQTQLIQLIHLLRQIETQVNSHQNDILQTLANHRAYLHKFFKKAIYYISTLHSQNHDIFLTTLNLLRAIFDNMGAILGSVEGGVDDLMQDLAGQMCDPMLEYAKGLKADMTNGSCARLLALVEEMEGTMMNGRLELEEAREKVRVAEEGKIEALCKLKETEERVRRMKGYLGLPSEAKKGPMEQFATDKFLDMEEDQEKDDILLWELLKKKRKYHPPESPMGPKELLYFEPNNKLHKSTRMRPSIDHRPVTRSCSRGLCPQTPCLDTWIPLGSSPSAAIQQVYSRKRINH